jgi:DNA-binding HxlR family transcriptional regulator
MTEEKSNSHDAKRSSGCPIAFGLDTFGDRWTLLIIREMMFHGHRTYGEFLEADEAISTNILATRLKHLESEGIIAKRRDPDNFRSFLYELEPKGWDLAPILFEIIKWGGEYDTRPNRLTHMVERVENDRAALEQEINTRADASR